MLEINFSSLFFHSPSWMVRTAYTYFVTNEHHFCRIKVFDQYRMYFWLPKIQNYPFYMEWDGWRRMSEWWKISHWPHKNLVILKLYVHFFLGKLVPDKKLKLNWNVNVNKPEYKSMASFRCWDFVIKSLESLILEKRKKRWHFSFVCHWMLSQFLLFLCVCVCAWFDVQINMDKKGTGKMTLVLHSKHK